MWCSPTRQVGRRYDRACSKTTLRIASRFASMPVCPKCVQVSRRCVSQQDGEVCVVDWRSTHVPARLQHLRWHRAVHAEFHFAFAADSSSCQPRCVVVSAHFYDLDLDYSFQFSAGLTFPCSESQGASLRRVRLWFVLCVVGLRNKSLDWTRWAHVRRRRCQ